MKAVVPQRRRLVFLSRQSNELSRDFRMLADAVRSRDPRVEVVFHVRMLDRSPGGVLGSVAHSLRQMAELASARVCVIDGYVVPVSLLDHRDGLTVIQMWHALGALKMFGRQTLDKPSGHAADVADAMRMHENYDVVLCSGPDTIPAYAAAFGTAPDKMRVTGLPRIDHLMAHAEDRTAEPEPESVRVLRERFPVLADRERTVVLYAPTLRRGGSGRCSDVVGRLSGRGMTLVVKPHPLESANVAGPDVVDAQGVDVLDLLPLCDVVITDYSAVALEAAVLGVPVLFWVYDIDEYRRDCGLNIDPLIEFPESASRDLEPLAERIESGRLDDSVVCALRDRVVCTLDGHCTDRIADLVMRSMEGV